jgi:hypothetical protein
VKILSRTFLFFIFILFASCTDEVGARKTLERNGYKVLSVGGYQFGASSENEQFATKFRAVAVNGDTVTGCVTRGYLKGSTIRLDD